MMILPGSALLCSHDARHRVSKSALIRDTSGATDEVKFELKSILHPECQYALSTMTLILKGLLVLPGLVVVGLIEAWWYDRELFVGGFVRAWVA